MGNVLATWKARYRSSIEAALLCRITLIVRHTETALLKTAVFAVRRLKVRYNSSTLCKELAVPVFTLQL